MDSLSKKQTDKLLKVFCLFDKDGDGCITIEELATTMQLVNENPTKDGLQEMISEADVNSKRMIEFGEFLILMARNMKEVQAEEKLKEAFSEFDKDQNGHISATELWHVMNNAGENLTNEEVQEMIEAADLDGDGQVNFEEFVRIMSA